MTPIETYMFMDFGTVRGDPSTVTEVSLLAVPRSQYLQPENIQEPTAKKTIKNLNGFDLETFHVINDFINQQQKPVCLVSHNGHRFDFRILKRELKKLNVSLSDDVKCADSLYTFYDLLKEDSKNANSTNIESFSDELEEQDPTVGEEDRPDPSSSNVNNSVDVASDQTVDYIQVANSQGNELEEDSVKENMESQNNKTPEKQILVANNAPIISAKKLLQSNHQNMGNAKRKLDFEESYDYTGKAVRSFFFDGFPTPPKGYYTLGAIYDREVKYPPVDHHPVENDVYSMFRISHKLGRRFLAWTDQIQYEFAKVEPNEVFIG